MNRKTIIIIVLVLAAGTLLFFAGKKFSFFEVGNNLLNRGDNFYGNPAENLPQTNPFDSQTNPFKGGYKNPFGK